jgi:hypothetical protein
MNRFFKISLFALFFAMLFSFFQCKKTTKTTIVPAFYFWKNDAPDRYYNYYYYGNNSFSEKADSLHPKRRYFKVLDVDWSPVNGAYPRSKNDSNRYGNDTIAEVPTVFITNRVFQNIKDEEMDLLANRILKVCSFYDYEGKLRKAERLRNEIQLDCDWTATTRDKYFNFLKIIKSKIGKDYMLSATVRLYQFKYREKTGVPPVDRAMIMLYNFNDLRKYDIQNSIFEKKEAEAYVKNVAAYPLPVDIALPLFSWGIGFHEGQFVSLHNDFHPEDADKMSFLKKEKMGYYEIVKDTVFQNYYYRIGDKMKIEYIDKQRLMDAADIARQLVNSDKTCIAFFHLDENILTYFDKNDFQNALNMVKK